MLLPVVTLKTPRNSRHPWIFKKMTRPPRGFDLEPGALVEVRDRNGAFVGRAFYHPENTVALRLLTERADEDIDAAFFRRRLERALRLRREVLDLDAIGDSFRLVHAEADGMPGLVVDKFADVLLVEPYIAGWMHVMPEVAEALEALFPGCRIAARADAGAAAKEGVSFAEMEARHPAPPAAGIRENGIRYTVDFARGHKTGFFLDQRDNRLRARALAGGRRVLDLCCYSGGFALSAWKGGARSVTAVDLDEKALAMARANIALNGAENIALVHRDAFDAMRECAARKETFGLVVLDPPKLAAGQEEVEKALRAYYDMNRAAVACVEAGGYFLTCSCSGAVAAERWSQAVRKAAADAGRDLCIFETAGPGRDHPVAGDFPQGKYLKALFARVG